MSNITTIHKINDAFTNTTIGVQISLIHMGDDRPHTKLAICATLYNKADPH